jgi:hypothetical protein
MSSLSELDPDAELAAFRRAAWRGRLKLALWGLLALVALALVPVPFDLGVAAWKLFRYDRVLLHFANTTGDTVVLQVGGSARAFAPGRVHEMPFRAGQVTITALRPDGTLIERLPLSTDNQSVFYNMAGSLCLAVMDVSGFYNEGGQARELEIIGRLTQADRFFLLPDGLFIPPRSVAPDQVPGGSRVTWIEGVGCPLLEPEAQQILETQQLIRMQGRRERQRERREQRRAQEQQP